MAEVTGTASGTFDVPAEINPNSTPQQAHDRLAFENEVNQQVERHLADWRLAATEALVAGNSVELVIHTPDEPDDSADLVKPYPAWTKDEPAEEAETRGLAKSGTKDELILRLSQDDAEAAAESADEGSDSPPGP